MRVLELTDEWAFFSFWVRGRRGFQMGIINIAGWRFKSRHLFFGHFPPVDENGWEKHVAVLVSELM